MNKNTAIVLILLIIILVAGSVIRYNNQKAADIERLEEQRQQEVEEITNKPVVKINTKHQYKNGVHTFIGTFETPTPCHSYNTELKPWINNGHEIAITYEESDEVCTQVITERQFRVSFGSESDVAIVRATINDEEVSLNIFEVSPDQDIDEFEIFIKG